MLLLIALSVTVFVSRPADCSLNYPLGKHVIHEVTNVSFSHLACEDQAAVVVHWSASPLGTCLFTCLSIYLSVHRLLTCFPTGRGLEKGREVREEEQEGKTFKVLKSVRLPSSVCV